MLPRPACTLPSALSRGDGTLSAMDGAACVPTKPPGGLQAGAFFASQAAFAAASVDITGAGAGRTRDALVQARRGPIHAEVATSKDSILIISTVAVFKNSSPMYSTVFYFYTGCTGTLLQYTVLPSV